MKIFLDTANVAEIKEGVALGVVDGVTTNPSLIAREKRPFRPLVEEICTIVPGNVSLEVVAKELEDMVKEGVIVCEGSVNGYIITDKEYDNYVLTLKWRWGKRLPAKGTPNSGVFEASAGNIVE